MLRHLYVEIDATEEQKQRLAPIVKEAARDLAPLREKLRAGRAQAIELLTQDRIDAAAIESLRTEKLRLADEASRRFTRALSDAAEILTPEQRKSLAQRFERHRHRWG
jgi:Spy/CpxP family protein refolding chaperone